MELLVEGQPFWDSFFGYHNLQRFTSVVNDHLQPWWFFGLVMLVAALPFTPYLLLGLARVPRSRIAPEHSLHQFAACWLLAVLLLFTTAATKLPSYWLPATPAAALLVAQATLGSSRWQRLAWGTSLALIAVLAAGFWLGSLWVPLIDDPEMPTLSVDLLASGLLGWAAVWFSAAAALGALLLLQRRAAAQALLAMQGCLLGFHLTALIPIAELADRLRQRPVRDAASLMLSQQRSGEPMVMVGAMKPSLHFYTGQVILYEGQSDGALVNIADRLAHEQRRGWRGYPLGSSGASSTVLVLIDRGTAERDYWSDLQPEPLGQIGIYCVWRLDRSRLEQRARTLQADGVEADWREPRPERY